ncbi:E3 ubiquitin-protein ligase PPP1R11 [Lonchura striata]
MAETAESGGCGTATVTESGNPEPEQRSLTLKLRKRKPDKKVEWSSDTVDNEHLGRRSSKCCCIFERPRPFGESSSESEGEGEGRGGEGRGCGHQNCVRGHRHTGGRGPPKPPLPPPREPPVAMEH